MESDGFSWGEFRGVGFELEDMVVLDLNVIQQLQTLYHKHKLASPRSRIRRDVPGLAEDLPLHCQTELLLRWLGHALFYESPHKV